LSILYVLIADSISSWCIRFIPAIPTHSCRCCL